MWHLLQKCTNILRQKGIKYSEVNHMKGIPLIRFRGSSLQSSTSWGQLRSPPSLVHFGESRRVWTAEREQDPKTGTKKPSAPRHTHEHRRTQTTCHPHDTDQIALIVIVPVEFVRFLCHLEARQSGLRRHELHTIIRTLKKRLREMTQYMRKKKKITNPHTNRHTHTSRAAIIEFMMWEMWKLV